ncbi:sigma-54 interaction domain-containing protein [Porphyromonas circumdentaria]|uniref:Regulatory protein, Fis family n=1 Tax=Porphyromonas circumdentaria TaxID=29524 RepID=A0A1T4MNK7_9PORP|nr:sigma 54-interacting transcriptional regulator [Porphyromonas circumdentaria]MBB6275887.1 transcriptional regulator with PAS, ATPase and Fis domain [Porphyromonas circumdentaria]MDO4722665.1 sigma 54-interacting transcriptional regulator [Porphyromonas circumdentaria]SJZ68374.1 regulatory protein, Fis family [Porphyromonas circumdentaria]
MDIDIQQIKQRFGIIGNAPLFLQALRTAAQVAPTDMSVLVVGESGVGKEFFPQIIHLYSRRKHNKYIAINCGAIPEGTIDSELFGHRKGSFTGALGDRKGYFEEANGGTIFLDEVGELPLATQARLLRVLENGEFIPVGASQPVKTDVRVVAATNVNLREAIRKGRFREDLFYRLNTVPIEVPPLRKRAEDIPLLFRRFASDFARLYQIPPLDLDEEAKEMLQSYRWPGNIRELRNITDRMSVLEEARLIAPATLRKYLQQEGLQDLHPVLVASAGDSDKGTHNFANEREILYQVLFDLRRELNEVKSKVNELLPQKSRVDERAPQIFSPATSGQKSADITAVEATAQFLPLTPAPLAATRAADETVIVDSEELAEEELPTDGSIVTLLDGEKFLIKRAMAKNKNATRQEIADQLGISVRTLHRKLKEYGWE